MNDTSSNLGLGARISMLFAVGGLLVSLVLAAATLLLTRQQLLDTREQAAAAMAISKSGRLMTGCTSGKDAKWGNMPRSAYSPKPTARAEAAMGAARAWRDDVGPISSKGILRPVK